MWCRSGRPRSCSATLNAIVEKFRAAGVPVEYQSEEGLFHVFQLFPLYPEAAYAVDRIGTFLLARTS